MILSFFISMLLSVLFTAPLTDKIPITENDSLSVIIPVAGNSWAFPESKPSQVSGKGWMHWNDPQTKFSTYLSLNRTGRIKVSAHMRVPEGESTIACSVNGITKNITAKGEKSQLHLLGEWEINATGYVRIEIAGIAKEGPLFAELTDLYVQGSAVSPETAFVRNNEGNFFYWGRRGPSVHLRYDTREAGDETEWFYSEITVPEGNDIKGSYYMANGFGEGYFGMQVNSETERRVLFSVWSPFETDDPSRIPDDQKIILVGKGKDVNTGEFGNEGSGGQSFLRYPWKAGQTYRFLLRGNPVENQYTRYTAYFFAPEENQWRLIASFNRPKTRTYLTRFHSFLENFNTETGDIPRKAYFHNQWVRNTNGKWVGISNAVFSVDNTGRKKFRLDYKGGQEGKRFFLQNCGFFNDSTTIGSVFRIQPVADPPAIDLEKLPEN